MDFRLTEAQLMLQRVAKEFAENEIAPIAAETDKTGIFPRELFSKMAKIGFNGIGTPVEYSGSGGADIEKVIVVTEIAKKCAASAAILSIHTIYAQAILKFGTEEQKKKYLPMMAEGGCVGAFALTEPNAGSDAARAATTAIIDEETDEYVLNGTKCFISGGGQAESLIIFALTDPSKGIKGMSNLLGKEGKGFNIAMTCLDGARIGVGAQAVGIAEGALEESIKYSKERVQFGKPISALQGIQWYIADMATMVESAKLLVYYAADLKARGEKHTKEAAMAKYNASRTAREVTNLALQIHGGYGYMKDYPLERMYRDAKITEIYEGTSEIHKVVISRAVLGEDEKNEYSCLLKASSRY